MATTKRIAKGRIVAEGVQGIAPVLLPISARDFSTRRRTPTQKRSLKTRRAILEAALSVTENQGIEKLTMQSIAAKAKIAAGTAYQFYDDRDAICSDIYLEWAEAFWSELMIATATPLNASNWEEELRALTARMGRFYFDHTAQYSLLRYVESTKAGGAAMRKILEANVDRYVTWFGPLLKEAGYASIDVRRICNAMVRSIRGHWAYGFDSAAQSKEMIRSAGDGVVAIAKHRFSEAPRATRGGKSSSASALR